MEVLAAAAKEASKAKYLQPMIASVKTYIDLGSSADLKTLQVSLNGEWITECPKCKKTWKTTPKLMFMCSFNHTVGRKTVHNTNLLVISWMNEKRTHIYYKRILLIVNRSHQRKHTLREAFTSAGVDLVPQ